jgi:hypothetical protein
MDQGVVHNRRELRQVFMGFRPRHGQWRTEDIKGGIRLLVREDERPLLRHRGQFPCGSPARCAPSCAGFAPYFRRFWLRGLVEGTEKGEQVVELVLGQAGQGFHLTIVSDVQPQWWAPSRFFEESLPHLLLRNNSIG